ncbi:biotin-dependent carboxyltransferase family protein [Pseudonocardia spinosispora]|uniref:5-oxoprolinase subunit C family protein n=1 Tax=Pseudonocardia spinosispora TaxID=103441 RepID=UPI00048BA427|nr:biotin-dependent carboxyltransferase family protein [Pseudonocardia spinosispora]
MPLNVLRPGLMTTVQDGGRIGHYHLGMPPSGAMDRYAYRVGAMLVGNADGEACLECTYFGPEIEFTEPTLIAVTGADLPAKINGSVVDGWTAHQVKAGDVLSFEYLRGGARAYLSVAGGIDVPTVLGSRSTYTLIGSGGLDGRPLKEGDQLKIGTPSADATAGASVPERLRTRHPAQVELRVVVGLSSYRVQPDSLAAFFETDWRVTPDANRVGYRYRGGSIDFVPRTPPAGAGSDPANVVDIGYPIGSIQVPGGSEPIALLHDAVTGGGYATIATIISADLAAAGQSKTNDVTRFVEVTLDEALQARTEESTRLSEVSKALREC